ncbi:hypothetical protein [Xylella fastidiosa]|uniref:hypothetical protein n=1 Tax=Xylella fastidiosa TaxID=2371 RepID=UPI0003055993|nr:hypothetical protein [Xylella fastidiosa]
MITLLTHISNAQRFGNVVGLALLAPCVVRAIGITSAVLLAAVAGEVANTAAAGLICRPVMIGASWCYSSTTRLLMSVSRCCLR